MKDRGNIKLKRTFVVRYTFLHEFSENNKLGEQIQKHHFYQLYHPKLK